MGDPEYIDKAMHHGRKIRYTLLSTPIEIGWMEYMGIGRDDDHMLDVGKTLTDPATLLTRSNDGPAAVFYYPVQVEGGDNRWEDANVAWFIQQKLKVVEANRDSAVQLVNEKDRASAFGFFHTAIVTALEIFEIALKTCWLTYTGKRPHRGHNWLEIYDALPKSAVVVAEWRHRGLRPHNIALRYHSIRAAIEALEKKYVHWRYWIDYSRQSEPLDIDYIVFLTILMMDIFQWDGQQPLRPDIPPP